MNFPTVTTLLTYLQTIDITKHFGYLVMRKLYSFKVPSLYKNPNLEHIAS